MFKSFYIKNIYIYIVIILVSLPSGLYIYWVQSNTISYEMQLAAGKSVAVNFCNVYTPSINPLVDPIEFSAVNKKLTDENLIGNNNYKVSLNFDGGSHKYLLSFVGNSDDKDVYNKIGNTIFNYLLESEKQYFNKIYSDIKLNCNNSSYKLFKLIPGKVDNIDHPEKKRFKKIHTILSSLSPFIVMCLLLIAFRIIRKNNIASKSL